MVSWFVLVLLFGGPSGIWAASLSTTTTLTITQLPNEPVIITATVTPSSATGKVTFYDGSAIIGVVPEFSGTAKLTTNLLPTGKRVLRARYWGNQTYTVSLSAPQVVTIAALRSYGFKKSFASVGTVQLFPSSVATGDFDGDGLADLVVANTGSANVTVLLGDGRGGFHESNGSPFKTGDQPISVAVGDFDGDGSLDLAVASLSGNTVGVLLGNGKGQFSLAQEYDVGGEPYSVTVADFNADGAADLAVANYSDSTVTVLLSNAPGKLSFTVGDPIAVDSGPVFITAADFNGDGNPDLVTANSKANDLTLMLGDGKGGFMVSATDSLATGKNPRSVITADFNGDGNPDLATADLDSDTVTIFLGDARGGFFYQGTQAVHDNAGPAALAVGDFNEDGLPDLAVAGFGSSDVTVLLGTGNGTFFSPPNATFAVGVGPLSIAIGDFNGDGRLDLVTVDNGGNDITVLLANPELTISLQQSGTLSLGTDSVYALSVQNGGEKKVIDVVTVSDTLPGGLTLKSASGAGWGCTVSDPMVTCSRSDGLVPGNAYPPIALAVTVTDSSCPAVRNTASVQNFGAVNTDSILTPVSGCIKVDQEAQALVVNTNGSITLKVTRIGSWATASGVSVTDVLPSGLTPTAAAGDGWTCPKPVGQLVQCTRLPEPEAPGSYPSISIAIMVAESSCPGPVNPVTATLGGGNADLFTLGPLHISGCLIIDPTTAAVDFGAAAIGGEPTQQSLTLTSSDSQPLQLTIQWDNALSFKVLHNCFSTLNFGNACIVIVEFLNPCIGSQTSTITIVASSGGNQSIYKVPVKGNGMLNAVSFQLEDGTIVPAILPPYQQHTVNAVYSPPLNPACPQIPTLAGSFYPDPSIGTYPVGTTFDSNFDSSKNLLLTGTVAGQIRIDAQINGMDVPVTSGPAYALVQVPVSEGVIQTVSIDNRAASSLEVAVTGYSTPREIGSTASTQVCFSFVATPGTTLSDTTKPFCALQADIEIWYERPTSYLTGSRFRGTVTVSFSGDEKAIGQIRAVLRNKLGDSTAYCLDVSSGDKCPMFP